MLVFMEDIKEKIVIHTEVMANSRYYTTNVRQEHQYTPDLHFELARLFSHNVDRKCIRDF